MGNKFLKVLEKSLNFLFKKGSEACIGHVYQYPNTEKQVFVEAMQMPKLI